MNRQFNQANQFAEEDAFCGHAPLFRSTPQWAYPQISSVAHPAMYDSPPLAFCTPPFHQYAPPQYPAQKAYYQSAYYDDTPRVLFRHTVKRHTTAFPRQYAP